MNAPAAAYSLAAAVRSPRTGARRREPRAPSGLGKTASIHATLAATPRAGATDPPPILGAVQPIFAGQTEGNPANAPNAVSNPRMRNGSTVDITRRPDFCLPQAFTLAASHAELITHGEIARKLS